MTQTQTITVQAIFETVYTVYFKHDGRTVATKELTDTQPSVSTGDVLVPVGADEKLTARVEKGHWIHFNSGGGSYVAPQFVTGDTIQPADPARPGFLFEGWYEESGKVFTFGSPLTSNITLTAHWKSNTSTKYTVIHWQENADNNEYAFRESEEKSGATGAPTSAAVKSYQGFTAQTITQQTINGDGSTIVNVYYKRNVYDVKFYVDKGRWIYTDWKEKTEYRITAKHGANISKSGREETGPPRRADRPFKPTSIPCHWTEPNSTKPARETRKRTTTWRVLQVTMCWTIRTPAEVAGQR